MASAPSVAGDRAVQDRAVLRKIGRYVMPLVLLLYIFNYMDRAAIGYAQLGMGAELGISVATYGTAAAIFFIAYVVFEVPSNVIMKKVGARIWLARIAITWGLVTVATGFVQNTTQLYIARIALGIAEAGLFPGLLLFLTYWFRSAHRGRAMARLGMAQPIALIVGSITGGLILDNISWFGASSWRWVFFLQGAPAVVIGVLVLVLLPNRPRDAKFLTPEEGERLEREIAAEQVPDGDDSLRAQLRSFRNPRVLHLAVINFLYAVGLYGMTFFLPQVVRQIDPDYSLTNIGLLGAIPYVLAAGAMLAVARYSDRTGNRKGVVMALLALAAIGLLGTIAFVSQPVLAIVFLSMVAIGVLSYLGPFWAMVSEGLSASQMAVGLAVINSIAAIGGFVGPYAIGKSATAEDVTLGLYFPVASLVLAIVLLVFWKSPARTADSDAGAVERV